MPGTRETDFHAHLPLITEADARQAISNNTVAVSAAGIRVPDGIIVSLSTKTETFGPVILNAMVIEYLRTLLAD